MCIPAVVLDNLVDNLAGSCNLVAESGNLAGNCILAENLADNLVENRVDNLVGSLADNLEHLQKDIRRQKQSDQQCSTNQKDIALRNLEIAMRSFQQTKTEQVDRELPSTCLQPKCCIRRFASQSGKLELLEVVTLV